jgi:exonuclease III
VEGPNLKVACFNTRSLCNKTCGVLELLKDNAVDICCVTESWLKSKDSAIFAEIHDHGYDIFSAPRRGRGGGVAFFV